jgi:hypothetical protein
MSNEQKAAPAGESAVSQASGPQESGPEASAVAEAGQAPVATPPPPAQRTASQAFLQDRFQNPVVTGIAATAIMALMRLIGMMPLPWLIIALPAIVSVTIYSAKKNQGKQD